MFSFELTGLRVRYADTDQMGYVYYGNYARFYEIARTDALRAIGLRYKDMEDDGVMMPVYENYSRFHQPAKYDELLTIRVFVKTMPAVRAVFNYEIFNEEGKLIHEGETTLVFVNVHTNRPVKAPPLFVEKMQKYFQPPHAK